MGIAVVFMLIAISFVSVVGSSGVKTVVGKKESPLYKIRTNRAIRDKVGNIVENIKASFIRGRIFIVTLRSFAGYVHIQDGPTPAQRSICCTGNAPTCKRCFPTWDISPECRFTLDCKEHSTTYKCR